MGIFASLSVVVHFKVQLKLQAMPKKGRKPRPLQIASIRCVIHFSYPVSCPKAFEGWPLYNICLRFVLGFPLKPLI